MCVNANELRDKETGLSKVRIRLPTMQADPIADPSGSITVKPSDYRLCRPPRLPTLIAIVNQFIMGQSQ